MGIIFIALMILVLLVSIGILLGRHENKVKELEINDSDLLEGVDLWLEELKKKGRFNGAVYCKLDNGKELKKTYGYSSHLKDKPIDFNTKFELASVSKSFTAFGMMVLIKKFDISYEYLVSKYIPDFPYSKVTIRHLLNQTSGIFVDYMILAKNKLKRKDYILNNKDAVNLICTYPDNPITNPLEVFYYNNSNYILIARIIEIVSELSFEMYMKNFVFEPLGLKDTFVWNLNSHKNIDDIENVALGFEAYFNLKPTKIKHTWIDGVAGDGAVFSSLNDLILIDKIWRKNNLLTENELQEAYKKPILNNGEESNYGFGWVLQEEIVWHNGKWLAANSVFIRNLENYDCFILLDNSSNPRFEKIQRIILSTLKK